MAKRGWEEGWPSFQWALPIKLALENEKNQARAERARRERALRQKEEDAREEARKDALETRVQEGHAVKIARGNVLGLNSITARLIQATMPLAERVKVSLETSAISPKETFRLLQSLAYISRQTNEMTRNVIEMERTRMGDPNDVNKELDIVDLPTEELIKELEGVQTTIARAREKGMMSKEVDDETAFFDEEDLAKLIGEEGDSEEEPEEIPGDLPEDDEEDQQELDDDDTMTS